MSSYWAQLARARVGRRRALLAASSAAAGAVFLAACGGDGAVERSSGQPERGGLVYTPEDTTSVATPGGTLKAFMTADITHFDNLATNNAAVLANFAQLSYLRLVGWRTAKYPEEAAGEVAGELAESWELSPDKLTLTMKVRGDVKWDARAPTNGRVADSSDVIYSWSKLTAGTNPAGIFYKYHATNAPNSPIESITAPDARTVVIKLHSPNAAVMPLLTSVQFSPQPREADGGFSPRTDVRGNGPFFVEEYVPSSHVNFRRNPDYYVRGRPFIDRIEMPIVADAAARLMHFRAGNIHTDVLAGAQEQVVSMKRDQPHLLMLESNSYPERDIWRATYGWEGSPPFADQRVRQAMSMLIDRETYIDVIDNRSGLLKEGIDLQVKYGTVIGAGWTGFYIDPTDEKEFGATGKYLRFNLPEAKKLLAAAGHANGFEFNVYWNNSGSFPIYNRIVELYNAMFQDGGLKPKLVGLTGGELQEVTNVYSSRDFKEGKKPGFTGMLLRSDRVYVTPVDATYHTMHKDGLYYQGISQAGLRVQDGDPRVNELTSKIRGEFDLPKQQALVQELTRYMTGQAYFLPQVSQAKTYSLWWPIIQNNGLYDSSPNESPWKESRLHWWLDQTKPPAVRA